MSPLRFTLIFLVLLSYPVFSNTLNVPADYNKIQAALNAADSGDTILVQPGTYYENIIWPNKNGLVLKGTSKESVIINGSNKESVIIISSIGLSIDGTTVIKDLSITNGNAPSNGGGISINNCSPTLDNLIIKNNSANAGNGIYVSNSESIIKNCNISENGALDWTGVGIYIKAGSYKTCLLYNCLIENNKNCGLENWSPIHINKCIFKHNGTYQIVTNVGCVVDSSILEGNLNITNFGIWSSGGTVRVRNSKILNHMSANPGSAITGGADTVEVINSVLAYNIARLDAMDSYSILGGALAVGGQRKLVIKNTAFIGNIAKKGGGVSAFQEAQLFVENCTFYNNSALAGGAVYLQEPAAYNIKNNNFINNGTAVYNDNSGDYADLTNNFWGDAGGPYHPVLNPQGKGDSVNYYMNVSPWLTEPVADAPLIFPANIQVKNTTQSSVTLSWKNFKVSDLAGVRIYYDTESSDYSMRNNVDAGMDTLFTLTGLQPGKKYYISLTSYDNKGEESWFSKPVSAITELVPVIEISKDEIKFDTLEIRSSKSIPLQINNTGTADLIIKSIKAGSSAFKINNIPSLIHPGNSFTIDVVFSPLAEGQFNDKLTILSNAVNNTALDVPLTGLCVMSTAPYIIRVADVPGDQGGYVRVSFQRSRFDSPDADKKISTYSVWRLISGDQWDAINLFNAKQDSIYNTVVPTLGDSTINGIVWSTFRVTAHTSDPNIFFTSEPLAGYSKDNISPAVPAEFSTVYANSKIKLSWRGNSDKDFQYYIIYRSLVSGFNPDSMKFTYSTADTIYIDENVEKNHQYFYVISAVDYAGNKSAYSKTVSVIISDVENNNIPNEFSLSQNYPNPFNPVTEINFSIPQTSPVTLRVFDIRGKEVATLINEEKNPGNYEVKFDGSNLSSGIYFYRIQAGSFSQTKKLILLK